MANLENAGRRGPQGTLYSGVEEITAHKPTLAQRLGPRLEPWASILVLGLALLVWETLSRLGQLSPLFFPAPSSILASLWNMALNGKLWLHTSATLNRLAIGFALGAGSGLVLGLGMGWSPRLRAIVDPIIAALHPIPKIAIYPLIMIIFGIGDESKIVSIAIAGFFPMLLNSMAGVRGLNPVYFEVTRNYGASRWKTFTRVVLPGSMPMVLTGARLAFNMAMVISIAVELLSAKEGLGVIIWFSWQTLRIEEMYGSLVIIALLGVAAQLILHQLTRRLTPWFIEGNSQAARIK
jgi:ABC-type nitrate/sulfonate/bicarbonate transport system permease component